MKNSELLTKLICPSAKANWTKSCDHFKYQDSSIRIDYQPGAVIELRQEMPSVIFPAEEPIRPGTHFAFGFIRQSRKQENCALSFKKWSKAAAGFRLVWISAAGGRPG